LSYPMMSYHYPGSLWSCREWLWQHPLPWWDPTPTYASPLLRRGRHCVVQTSPPTHGSTWRAHAWELVPTWWDPLPYSHVVGLSCGWAQGWGNKGSYLSLSTLFLWDPYPVGG
jgi:hypothetical protein